MIQRPKQSVTRFFIPLIDVLILLFCIFLLMPFVSQANPSGSDPTDAKPQDDPLSTDVETLRRELEVLKRELKRMQTPGQTDLAEQISIKLLEVDLATGRLIEWQNGQRNEIGNQKEAEAMIDRHVRASGGREPLFLILLPKRGAPLQQNMDNYRRWFANVPYSFDEAIAPRTNRERR